VIVITSIVQALMVAAASLVGYSEATIKRAVRAGDLPVVAGTIDGTPVDKPVIRRADLDAWLQTISATA